MINFSIDDSVSNLAYHTIRLSYGEKLVFVGYVDDLVTSTSGNLELVLNLGEARVKSPHMARFVNNMILWIPNCDHYINDSMECFYPMSFTRADFERLWNALGYDPENDLQLIKRIDITEIQSTWLLSSGINMGGGGVKDWKREISRNVLTLSDSNRKYVLILNELLEKTWSEETLKFTLVKAKTNWVSIVVYVGNNAVHEWHAFRKDEFGDIFVHLGNDICFPLTGS